MLATMYRPLRTIAMTDRKAYNAAKQREYRRNNVHAGPVESVHIEQDVHADVHASGTNLPSHDTFAGIGRGIPYKGYVLVSNATGQPDRVVSERAWIARLYTKCTHGLSGWACKVQSCYRS